jgi:hypothetical protein
VLRSNKPTRPARACRGARGTAGVRRPVRVAAACSPPYTGAKHWDPAVDDGRAAAAPALVRFNKGMLKGAVLMMRVAVAPCRRPGGQAPWPGQARSGPPERPAGIGRPGSFWAAGPHLATCGERPFHGRTARHRCTSRFVLLLGPVSFFGLPLSSGGEAERRRARV